MGHGGASGRPLGRSRSAGFLSHAKPSFHRNLYQSRNAQSSSKAGTMNRWSLFTLALLILFLTLAGATLLSLQWSEVEYAVVIDSGSTGTRCYVYSWARSSGSYDLPKVVDSTAKLGRAERFGQKRVAYKRVETEPGLDMFVGNTQKLAQALEPLLQYALKEVPPGKRPATPIFLFATAGLRRLPPKESAWILEEAQSLLSSSPFLFKSEWARIISGQDEAIYGWIALNYLTGRLARGDPAEALGSLDLGGSSLEVTFLPEEMPAPEHGMNVTIRNTEYQLFAHSHSLFGMNDAFERSVRLQMDDQPSEDITRVVEHPCLHAGYNATYLFKDKGPKPTVATSALADKALSEKRRRLLWWGLQTTGINSFPRSELGLSKFISLMKNVFRFLSLHSSSLLQHALSTKVQNLAEPIKQLSSSLISEGPEIFLDLEAPSVPALVARSSQRMTAHASSSSLDSTFPSQLELSNTGAPLSRLELSIGTETHALTFPINFRKSNTFPRGGVEALGLDGKRPRDVDQTSIGFHASQSSDYVDGNEAVVQSTEGLPEKHESGSKWRRNRSESFKNSKRALTSSTNWKRRSTLEGAADESSVTLVGKPGWGACQELVDRVVTSSPDCEEERCALGAHQPTLRGQFMALTGFYVVYHFFGFDGRAPLGRLLEAAESFCNKSWTEVERAHYGERGYDRYCFRAPYVVSLLRKGLGLRDEQVQVGTGDMAWTLGAALYEGGALKSAVKEVALEHPDGQSMSQLLEAHRSKLPSASGFLPQNGPVLVVLLVAVGLTAVTVVRWWKARARSFDARARRAYLPLYNPGSKEAGKLGNLNSRRLMDRQRLALLEPIPASPPSVPVKAPSQTRLATRRTSSEMAALELQRNFAGSELDEVEEEYSP